MSRRLALTLYRATLRWSRANADVPFSLKASDVYWLAPQLRGTPLALQDAGAVAAVARQAFEACRNLTGAEAHEALDRGLEGVRLLHTTYAEQLQAMRDTRRDRGDKTGVKFAVGQVFQHKKFGYRGVVFGWDRSCERDAEWQRQMSIRDGSQPFYHCLPDEGDAIRLFGGVRITKYVAQENMEPVSDCRIVHRALDNFFAGYSPSLGRYIPSRKLQYEYPDQYEAEDAAPLGNDNNLLAHEEPEPSRDAPSGERVPGLGGDGRSFANAKP
ncbi:hypothetical protein ABPG75_011480 [Micractinium tetrahymenae]